MKALKVLPDDVELSQIHIVLKLSGVPPLYGHLLDDQTSLCKFARDGVACVFICRLLELSSPIKYTQAACYFCPVKGCDGSYGFKYVRVHMPGAAEQCTTGDKFTCSVCKAQLIEGKSYRKLSDKRILIVSVRNQQGMKDDMELSRRLRVICRDEEAAEYSVGEELMVTGRLAYDTAATKNLAIVVEASSVESMPLHEATLIKSPVNMQSLPASISELYQESITPAGTFVKLKLALLLSVLAPYSQGLNILCTGQDTLLLNRLLHYFSCLIPGSVVHSCHSLLFGESREDKQSGSEYFISGGSCLLAHNSTCVIPDLSSISKRDERHLLRDDLSSDYQREVAAQSLRNALGREDNSIERISQSDLKQFVEVAKALDMSFPEEVKSYLSKFYLASRQVRADINPMPTASLRTLLTIAESHARLSLRSEVLLEDALAAILLYEEYLTFLTNFSVVSVNHEPHWKAAVVEYYLTEQNDDGMRLFRRSVDEFCKLHCPSSIEE
ncbi:minichromosome maintenance domain-containing protein 2-like [Watersipora subatra]|uniref:minichromosome maintenance domain-containing protein 2-like n=1 Tax=Watersipora subatra TaxID=2589382 RepID=UPI00355BB5A6